jgi:hypothetical protein
MENVTNFVLVVVNKIVSEYEGVFRGKNLSTHGEDAKRREIIAGQEFFKDLLPLFYMG